MDLKLVRTDLTSQSTVGELYVDGKFECYTLEDVVRPVKIKGMTAISAGVYEVVISHSARFQRLLPLLLNVPNFDGIRIHAGNTAADTEGCLLVGQGKASNAISGSRNAFNALFAKLQAAAAREKIFIEIGQGQGVASARGAMPGARSVRREMTQPPAAKAAKPAKPAKPAAAAKPGKVKKMPGKDNKRGKPRP
jgi:Family of unknown function (DUF5675)